MSSIKEVEKTQKEEEGFEQWSNLKVSRENKSGYFPHCCRRAVADAFDLSSQPGLSVALRLQVAYAADDMRQILS